jgi:glucokinase
MDYVAGIDLGGTSAKLGLVDRGGRILARERVTIDPRADAGRIMAPILQAVRGLGARMAADRLVAAGLGTPGFVDIETGMLTGSENIPGMQETPIFRLLSEGLGVPAFVDNDANCAAAGELAFGAGSRFSSFLLATVGTGIGGGLVLGGRLWRGARGFAGEIGHMCLDPLGPWCPCGARGCLEQYAAGPAIVRLYRSKVGQRGPAASLDAPEEVARLAAAGDRMALAAFDEAGAALAQAFGSILNLLNLDACLVGGGVAAAGEILLEPLRRHLPDFVYPLVGQRVTVVPAALGNDAGLLGAAALAFGAGAGGSRPPAGAEGAGR